MTTISPRSFLAAGAALVALLTSPACAASDAENLRIVREILRDVPLFDGHNDVPWQYRTRVGNRLDHLDFRDTSQLDPPMHTDLVRLHESGIGAQFWSVYIPVELAGPGAVTAVLEQIDLVHRLAERHPRQLEVATTADDVLRIHAAGKVASLIGMEGGHSIENSLGVLRQLYRAGARYMTLTHSSNVAWADSATDTAVHGGLTEFGREVVREMNRLGMLVDLSHVAATTMHDALDVAEAPVIFSHSSARGTTDHPRNVPDDVLERLPDNGGVVMVTFVPPYINDTVRRHDTALRDETARLEALHGKDAPEVAAGLRRFAAENRPSRASLSDVADHIDHIRAVAGIEHIGIGSDFDGITSVPAGLEDVSRIPHLLAELLTRGYSRKDVEQISGRNLIRVLRASEAAAQRLRQERPPSEVSLGEADGGAGVRSDP